MNPPSSAANLVESYDAVRRQIDVATPLLLPVAFIVVWFWACLAGRARVGELQDAML